MEKENKVGLADLITVNNKYKIFEKYSALEERYQERASKVKNKSNGFDYETIESFILIFGIFAAILCMSLFMLGFLESKLLVITVFSIMVLCPVFFWAGISDKKINKIDQRMDKKRDYYYTNMLKAKNEVFSVLDEHIDDFFEVISNIESKEKRDLFSKDITSYIIKKKKESLEEIKSDYDEIEEIKLKERMIKENKMEEESIIENF